MPFEAPALFCTVTRPLCAPSGTLTEIFELDQLCTLPALPPANITFPEPPNALPSSARVSPTRTRFGLMRERDGATGAGVGAGWVPPPPPPLRAPKSCTQ